MKIMMSSLKRGHLDPEDTSISKLKPCAYHNVDGVG
jgi:hypothetical protein